jgi:hypothetical protein
MLSASIKKTAIFVMPALVVGILILGTFLLRLPVPAENYDVCLNTTQKNGIKNTKCEKTESFWRFSLDDPTAYYALWVAGFTGILAYVGVVQGLLISRQIGQTDRALDISDRALTIAQWPRFYIEAQRFVTPISRPDPSVVVQFHYTPVVNGTSPAMIRAVYGELIFDRTVPIRPPEKKLWKVIHGVQKDGFGNPLMISWDGENILSTQADRVTARKLNMWIYAIGCIVFDDLFGNQHEFSFCYKGAIGGGWGIRAGGDNYNYHRRRSDAERAEIDSLSAPPPNEAPEPPENPGKKPTFVITPNRLPS